MVVTLVVDVANVMGSRPDGWWRDRAGAATRWLADLNRLPGTTVRLPDGARGSVGRVVAVLEGRAREAHLPQPCAVEVVLAERDGDSAVVAQVRGDDLADVYVRDGKDDVLLVVTADRGLRQRLPVGVAVAGPGWLRALLD